LRDFDGVVTAFNTNTASGTIIDPAQLSVFSGAAVAGSPEFWAEGDIMVTVAETLHTFKMVNLAQDPPIVTTFADPSVEPDPIRENETTQLALDLDTRQMVAQITDFLVLYDLDNPGASPQVWNHAHEKSGNGRAIVRLANLNDGTAQQLERNPGAGDEFDLQAGVFAYFVNEQDSDFGTNGTSRVVAGQIGAAGPEFTIVPPSPNPLGDDPADGNRGYGCSVAITPNGEWVFLAGCGWTVFDAEYFQYSRNGSDFELLPDELGEDFYQFGLKGAEVDASDEVVAFLSAETVAYIVLP